MMLMLASRRLHVFQQSVFSQYFFITCYSMKLSVKSNRKRSLRDESLAHPSPSSITFEQARPSRIVTSVFSDEILADRPYTPVILYTVTSSSSSSSSFIIYRGALQKFLIAEKAQKNGNNDALTSGTQPENSIWVPLHRLCSLNPALIDFRSNKDKKGRRRRKKRKISAIPRFFLAG